MRGLLLIALLAAPLPPGGHWKNCYGWIDHVSLENMRVHCTNGIPADLSFISWPTFVDLPDGKTLQSKDLKPGTRVHVIFTQSLGLRQAYKVFVLGPMGHARYGIKG